MRQKYRKRISQIRIAGGCDVRRIRGSPVSRFSPCFVQPNTGYNRDTLLSFCDSQQYLVSSAVQNQTMETLVGEIYIWFDGVAPDIPETSRLKVIMNDKI